jgi:hypothetical protein
MDPCGTPDVTGSGLDVAPSIGTKISNLKLPHIDFRLINNA